MRNLYIAVGVTVLFCCALPITLEAATLGVASNGIDSTTCGGKGTPCRSISQAIANAFDGDRIIVGPGTYGPGVEGVEVNTGCVCMIHITKSLTIESRDGAEVTLIDVAREDASGVLIEANQVIFGKMNKGFTIANSRRYGLILHGSTSNIQGNVAFGNGSNGNDAFEIGGSSNTVIGNKAINNARGGFVIDGEDHTVTGNVASGNLQGFDVRFNGRFDHNSIIGNRVDGLLVYVRELFIRDNDVIGNGQHGIRILNPFDGIITKNNIFDNVGCGLDNQSGGVVNAPHNFWGAATGPGPNPADEICNDLPSTTIFDPVATKEFN